jgi:hypothetical protein
MLKSLPIGRLFSLSRNGHTYKHSVLFEYSVMAKIRSREAMLLILPLIILLPVAFKWKLGSPLLQNATVTPQSGYVAQVHSVEVEPATAREVYNGYDHAGDDRLQISAAARHDVVEQASTASETGILGGGARALRPNCGPRENAERAKANLSLIKAVKSARS